jgi:hypothetical protein
MRSSAGETSVHDRPYVLVIRGLIITLALGILPWAVAGIDAANAQTTGASDNPSAFLAAPSDGVDFYLKTETAARLLDEKKWPEAEALLLELTRAYPFSSAYATNHSNWGRAIADGVGGKPRHLIVDIRHNNGGNSFQYIELLRTLVAFSAGEGQKVYVLIGRNVYSAAANLSTDLERLVRPVFVGEPTSGTGNQWGDESRFILPYSGLTGAFSGVRWQLSNPWDQRRSIVPQVPVQLTAGDYFAGRDPALDAVFRLIRESEAKPPVSVSVTGAKNHPEYPRPPHRPGRVGSAPPKHVSR